MQHPKRLLGKTGGVSKNMDEILTKDNEKRALGIGVDKFKGFNKRIKSITIFKKDIKDN